MSQNSFPEEYFAREDENDDSMFYAFPRKVVHLDETAIAALGTQFEQLLPPGGVYLDLMSSWRSHLPESLQPQRVVGLGMNHDEMSDNPQLSEVIVHDLNADPSLPFEDGTFDAVLCTASVQYLTQPTAVFRDVQRVLKPGGIFIVSFSNRCFPSKAIAAWRAMSDMQHLAFVTRYFELAGEWNDLHAWYTLEPRDPLYAVWAKRPTE